MVLLALTWPAICISTSTPSLPPSLVLVRSRFLLSLYEEHKQKAQRVALIPSVLLYFHFYLLCLLWIHPGRDGCFTTRQIYSGDSRHCPALKDLMHESMQRR